MKKVVKFLTSTKFLLIFTFLINVVLFVLFTFFVSPYVYTICSVLAILILLVVHWCGFTAMTKNVFASLIQKNRDNPTWRQPQKLRAFECCFSSTKLDYLFFY